MCLLQWHQKKEKTVDRICSLKLCDPDGERLCFAGCFCVEGVVTYCMCGYIIMCWIHKLFPEQWKENTVKKNIWVVLSDEQMSNGSPCSLLNDEQMINKVGVEHQPDMNIQIQLNARLPIIRLAVWW